LNEIGFEWLVDDRRVRFEELKTFQKQHRHYRIPRAMFKDSDTYQLASWVIRQQRHYTLLVHVAGAIAEYGVRVGRTVVEELGDSEGGGLGALGLGGCECAKRDEHGRVHGAGVEKEDSNYFLGAGFSGSVSLG
jgi:hypothetical protein